MIEFLNEMVPRKVAGCAAIIHRGGKCVFRGFAGMARAGTPVNEHTAFRLASMTKPVTAVAALLCIQDGLLRLDDPVSEYLPAFHGMRLAELSDGELRAGGTQDDFTLRQLLTHSAGVGAGKAGDLQYPTFKPKTDLSASVAGYSQMLLDFRPGSAQMYSPIIGFDIVARLVETVSGTPYEEFLQRRVFGPLGMKETSYRLSRFKEEDIASTYREDGGKQIEEPTTSNFDDFPPDYTGGGAGLMTTADDYARFAEMLRRARNGEDAILSRESALELSRPQLDESMEGICPIFNWGLGVRVLSLQTEWQPLPATSFGWSGAYGTHFFVDPADDLTAVYLHSSSTYGGSGAPHTVAFERAVMNFAQNR